MFCPQFAVNTDPVIISSISFLLIPLLFIASFPAITPKSIDVNDFNGPLNVVIGVLTADTIYTSYKIYFYFFNNKI